MEQKTNPSGEQDATQEHKPTPWIERVTKLADEIGNELDNSQTGKEDRRGLIVVAVDGTETSNDKPTVLMAAISGNSIALGIAVKHVLTGEPFAKHLQTAAKMMTIDAVTGAGKGTVVIDLRKDEADDQEPSQEGAADVK